jgi:5-methylcytosine-specific restriction endonuclease McrA
MNQEVLVLNSDYEPLNVCHVRRAIVLVYLGKADILHVDDGHCATTTEESFIMPSVVKLRSHVKRPIPELKLSRRTIFARDNYTCQYCGSTTKDLTIDHVIPKRAGGKASWDNLVTCCRRCNIKKSDKLAHQMGMKLARPPRRPRYTPYISLTKYLLGRKNEVWKDYLPTFADLSD